MAWTKNTLGRFTRITGVDFTQLMSDFVNFNNNLKQDIYDYYGGETKKANGEAFRELDRLRDSFREAITVLKLNSEAFKLYEDWELFSDLEDIDTKLLTIFNSSKFLRSGISQGNFSGQPLAEITLKNNQTLENLANNLNASDPQNDWLQIFLNNQLTEEDYTYEGGNLLKVTFQGGDPLFLNSVIDNIDTADKTYGKDLKAKITFDSDEDDLKVLTYKETLYQTIEILSELTKGSVPENPNQGIQKSLVVGSTIGSVAFPALFRQLYQNFASDDSFKAFSLTNIEIVGDAIKLNFEVTTKSDEIQEGSLTI